MIESEKNNDIWNLSNICISWIQPYDSRKFWRSYSWNIERLAFLFLPEKHTDTILNYVGIIFGFVQEIALKLMNGFSKTVKSGAKKSTAVMNETSLRATGHKTVKCPHCKSTNISYMNNNRKSFSVRKAIAGSALIGSTGVLAGLAVKKGRKNTWHCQVCGKTFTK